MKRFIKTSMLALLVFCCSFILVACGGTQPLVNVDGNYKGITSEEYAAVNTLIENIENETVESMEFRFKISQETMDMTLEGVVDQNLNMNFDMTMRVQNESFKFKVYYDNTISRAYYDMNGIKVYSAIEDLTGGFDSSSFSLQAIKASIDEFGELSTEDFTSYMTDTEYKLKIESKTLEDAPIIYLVYDIAPEVEGEEGVTFKGFRFELSNANGENIMELKASNKAVTPFDNLDQYVDLGTIE